MEGKLHVPVFVPPVIRDLQNLSGLQRIYKLVGVPVGARARGWTRYVPTLSVHPVLMNAKAWKHLVGKSSNLAQMSADSEGVI